MRANAMKKTMLALAMIGLLPCGGASASADSYAIATGDDLGQVCANPAAAKLTDKEHERLLVCGAYIRGYLGHYSTARSLLSKAEFCLPQAGVSPEQVRKLYVAVLEKRPQIRDYPAAVDLTSILAAAYPCKAGTSP